MAQFVHLHTHSYYSHDGVPSLQALVARAASLGMPALALTDHNSIAGFDELDRLSTEYGIKPVFGVELDLPNLVSPESATFSMILLIEQDIGYRNICRLLSAGSIDREILREFNTGTITLIGGKRSELFSLVSSTDKKAVETYLNQIVSIWGVERIFFEIQSPTDIDHHRNNQRLVRLASVVQIPLVITNNVHYINPEDDICRKFLRKEPWNTDQTLYKYNQYIQRASTLHFLTEELANSVLPDLPEAVANTKSIAERCSLNLPELRKQRRLYNYDRGRDPESFLWDLISQQSKKKYRGVSSETKDRINQEFDYITQEGLSEFLIFLHQLRTWTRENTIFITIRSGSILSSVIAYVLDITDIDPMTFHFRFAGLKEQKDQLAEVTFEVASRDIHTIRKYFEDTYGVDHIASAGKIPSWHKGALFLEVGLWAGKSSVSLTRSLSMPDAQTRSRQTVSDMMKDADLSALTINDLAFLSAIVSTLGNRPRQVEPVRSGIIIAPQRIDSAAPVRLFPDSEIPVSMVTNKWLDKLRLIRIQLAHSTVMDIIRETLASVAENEGVVKIPEGYYADENVYRLLATGKTTGIPFFDGVTARSLLRRQKPRDIFQIVRLRSLIFGQQKDSESHEDKDKGTSPHQSIYSIVADSLLGLLCAYLMTRFPNYYTVAVLNNSARWQRRIFPLIRALRSDNNNILPPDINFSDYDFVEEDKGFRAGLKLIKGIGERIFAEIDRVRRGGAYHDLIDFCRRTDSRLVNYRIIENLIKSGAFDSFGKRRSEMLAVLDKAITLARQRNELDEKYAVPDFFDRTLEEVTEQNDLEFSRYMSLDEIPLQAKLDFEKQSTGVILSGYGYESYQELLDSMAITPLWRLLPKHLNRDIHFVGAIEDIQRDGPLCVADIAAVLLVNGFLVIVPRRLFLRTRNILYSDEPMIIGGKTLKQDGELFVRAFYIATLREVQRVAESTTALEINMIGENIKTAKMIYSIMKEYPGFTKVVFKNFDENRRSRLVRKIEDASLVFCPPVHYQLLKILPERAITIISDVSSNVTPHDRMQQDEHSLPIF